MEDEAAITEDLTGAASDLVSDNPGDLEYITEENQGFEDLIATEQPVEDGTPTEVEAAETAIVEKSDEEKALDEELKAVQPTGLVKHLRGKLSNVFKERGALNARVSELEGELTASQEVMFRPTVPAEEFESSGKGKAFWDEIARDHPAYYTPLVNDVLRAHLNPERMAANPGSVPQGVLDAFAQQWLPRFIQETFGMDVPSFSSLIERHRSGTLGVESNGRGDAPLPVTSEQVAAKYGLDPVTDADLINEMVSKDRDLAAERSRLSSIEAQVRKLSETQNGTFKQQQEREAEQRIGQFNELLTSDKKNLLDTALQALPKDPATGQVLKEFAHLPGQIADLVDVALNRDAQYKASRDATARWFKQPGSAETATALAGGDLKRLHGYHQTLVTQIAKDALAPYQALIHARGQIEQRQRSRVSIPGGGNPSTASSVRAPIPRNPDGRSLSLGDRIRLRQQGGG